MATEASLYTADQLLGLFREDAPRSYVKCLDAERYRSAVIEGLRVPADDAVAESRAGHDQRITRALLQTLNGRKVVAIMGGHKLSRDSDEYRAVAEIARTLTREEFVVVSGGGPGAMEATHLGASCGPWPDATLDASLATLGQHPRFPPFGERRLVDSDGAYDWELLEEIHTWQVPAFSVARITHARSSFSVGIPTWLYGHEPPSPLAPVHAKYYENSLREDGLLAIAKRGVVFAQGSAGTIQEIFQDAAQNYYRSVEYFSPMVFLDFDNYWSVHRPVKAVLESLMDAEQEKLLHFVDSVEKACSAIRLFTPPGDAGSLMAQYGLVTTGI